MAETVKLKTTKQTSPMVVVVGGIAQGMIEWMNEWMNKWMNEWMAVWMDKQIQEWMTLMTLMPTPPPVLVINTCRTIIAQATLLSKTM